MDIWQHLRKQGIRPYQEADSIAPERVWQALLSPQSPITRIFNSLVKYAIKDQASEIHIVPHSEAARIFFRIDGELREQMTVPSYVLAPLLARIKIMGAMNVMEEGVPQAGSMQIALSDQSYDLHIGTRPTQYGEKIIIEIN